MSNTHGSKHKTLTAKQRVVVLMTMVVIGVAALTLAVVFIVKSPVFDNGNAGLGVASGGYSIRVEPKSDIGVAKVVAKDDVVAALGANAQSVGDAKLSEVINLNGSRSQTLTYGFTNSNGRRTHIYIDMSILPSQSALDELNITAGSTKAKDINGHSVYYMQPWVLGSEHQDRLLIVNGLKVYKFIVSQSNGDFSMDKVTALAALIRLAQKAQL